MPWAPGLAVVNALRPVSFQWKTKDVETDPPGLAAASSPNKGRAIGFLAQDVQKLIPEAVRQQDGWGSGGLTLDDRAIIAALVNAVQELGREVDRLKRK